MTSTRFPHRLLTAALAVSLSTPAWPDAPDETHAAMALPVVHAMRHPGSRPVVVVVAQHEAVLSDFVVPYGVLAQSGAAEVIAVNMADGPLKAGPVTLVPDMTAAEFDRQHPEGADYVIVPATAEQHAQEIAWLRTQRAQGAALVSICDGVELLAEAGALEGRRATGHWASLADRRKAYPGVTWMTNVRYLADGDVASSAGVSASLPISLALLETIAGAQVAHDTATRLGVAAWSPAHDSDVFKVGPKDIAAHVVNTKFKRNEVVALGVAEGDDEVALSLHAEVWSRTMRDKVRIVSERGGMVRLRGGLRIESEATATVKPDLRIDLRETTVAGQAASSDLDLVAHRYSAGTARLAALGMEYPWGDLQALH